MKKKGNTIFVGCSGYYYPDWKGRFYPEKLASSKWLQYYSSIFNTVELNSTFYHQPKLASLKTQYKNVPADFKFSIKMNRYITHIRRLKNTKSHIADFTGIVQDALQEKLDKFLFQLPPSFRYNEQNLQILLENVPGSINNVIEFRHESWWNPNTARTLKKNSITFCNVDFPGLQNNFISTSKNFYLRLHGVPRLFYSSYSAARLKELSDQLPKHETAYNIYFNNTAGIGFKNALTLRKILAEQLQLH